jgi:transcriptional regulator with XRE-family HTH domain
MSEKSDIIGYQLSDTAILQHLGSFIRETRLMQNKTQEEVSHAAGIERMTLMRIEKGSGGTLSTFIRLLRTLEQLHILNQFQLPIQISPLQVAKLELSKRRRARPNRRSEGNTKKSDW